MELHFHPLYPRLDMVVVAGAGDKIEGEAPKERPGLGGSRPGTLHWPYGGYTGTRPLFHGQLHGKCVRGRKVVRKFH